MHSLAAYSSYWPSRWVFLLAILTMIVKSFLEVQWESKDRLRRKTELSNPALDDKVTTVYPAVTIFLLVAAAV